MGKLSEQHLQYAPTAPGAPLSDEEKQEISPVLPAGYMGSWISALWRKIDAVLAKRNTALPAPADGMVSLDEVEKAIAAYLTSEQGWLSAAAKVAANRICARLSPPKTPEERVTVKYRVLCCDYGVWKDDLLFDSCKREDSANYMAAGLIAELAKEQK